MNTQDYNTLTEVIEAMIDEGEKPIKAIAAEISKPYPTLKRELNPADDGAKLGADVLLGIMASCGSIAPLEWLADRLGYVVKRKDWAEPDRATWGEEMADVQEAFGVMASSMLKRVILRKLKRMQERSRTSLIRQQHGIAALSML